jgi:hypothetical protein
MTSLTQRRVAGVTAILVLLFTMQAVVSVPAVGVEDTTCQKVEDADLGVEGLQVTVDGHVDVTFYDWVGTPNEYSAVTVDVTGLLANEDLVWSTKAGSAQGETLETNDGVISEDGTYTIGRAADAIRGISHITLCVVETPETPTARLIVEKYVDVVSGDPETTMFEMHVTGQPDFMLTDGETAMFDYDMTDLTEIVVTVEEDPIAEPGWTTSIECGATVGATVTLEAGDVVTCLVTNTFEAPTTTTTTTTTTTPTTATTTPTTSTTDTTRPTVTTSTVTTPEVTVTTAGPEAEVLGTTITAPAEVTSDTLPFTGTNTGSLAVGGLLALLAGLVALRVSPRVIEEEGRWSDC